MDLNEFQAKEIFRQFEVPVPDGGAIARSSEEAVDVAGGNPEVVIKAQAPTGGRGKAGGVKLANNNEEVRENASTILGMSIGELEIKKVLVEAQVDIQREMYLSFVQDRENEGYRMVFSEAGGIEIEELASTRPEEISMVPIEPFPGLLPFQLRDVLGTVGKDMEPEFRGTVVKSLYQIMNKLYRLFVENDATLAEINPLVVRSDGACIACDAKLSIDNNALTRHPDLLESRLPEDENPLEKDAREKSLSYVKLSGDIGCLVNGAGLAMATMDVIKHYEGEPANFLDVGGGAKPQQVRDALEIIDGDEDVSTIFINIFGGIVRCDEVADGIIQARNELDIQKDVVIRLIGTNDQQAYEMLEQEGLPYMTSMAEGASQAVQLAKRKNS